MARSLFRRTQSVRFALPVILLSSMSALAQDATLPPVVVGGQLPDDLSGLQFSQPTATASRLGLTQKEIPASTEVMTSETIRERGYSSVNEAVSHATGFNSLAAPGNGGTSLAVRGFAGHTSLMQLYDGTQLYIGSGTLTFPFDTWNVDRIEVLRGPASVMSGNGAIGGVVNVISKKPNPKLFENEAMLEFGSDMTRHVAAGSGGPISNKLSYRADVSGRKSDGWLDRNDESESLALSLALRAEASENFAITLSHDYGYQQPMRYLGTPLRRGLLERDWRKTNFNVDDSLVEYHDNWTQLKMDWQAADNVTVHNLTYMLGSDRHWRNTEGYTFNTVTGLVNRNNYLEIAHDQQQYGNRGEVVVDYTLAGLENRSTVGFDVNRVFFTHTNNNNPSTGASNGSSTTVNPYGFTPGLFATQNAMYPRFNTVTDQYALFVEDRLKVTEAWSLIGGLRHDRIHVDRDELTNNGANSFVRDFRTTSWRAGTVYNVTPSTALYGQYATAADPVGGLITLASSNNSFELATGEQVEIGVKQDFWGKKGEWTLAGYEIVKKNVLSQNATTQVTQQIGQQSARGIETTLAFNLGDWRIGANLAFLDARFDKFQSAGATLDGKTPSNVPEQLANLYAAWHFASEWTALGGVRYVGETYSDNANTQPRAGYSVVDLGLEWSPMERVTVALRVFNLFDEVYAITAPSVNQWVLGAPRTALLSTSVKF